MLVRDPSCLINPPYINISMTMRIASMALTGHWAVSLRSFSKDKQAASLEASIFALRRQNGRKKKKRRQP
jgi:hypothetical protein